MRALSPALIHAHFGPDATHAMPLARALGVPLLVTHHGYDVTTEDHALARSPWLRFYLKRRARLYQAAALVLCVSQFVREKAVRKGAPPHKTLVHYIGIDTRLLYSRPVGRAFATRCCSSAGWSRTKDASSCCTPCDWCSGRIPSVGW